MHRASDLDIDFVGGRAALLADTALQGRHFSDAYRTLTDAWLAQLFERAAGDQQGVALLAVGGYGRGELCPGSDLDVLLLHAPKTDVAKLAERIWYPIWDAKVHLGHAVRTVKEALSLAADDLDTATALLDAPPDRRRRPTGRRPLLGCPGVVDEAQPQVVRCAQGIGRRAVGAGR